MRKVLVILGELRDADIDWIVDAGTKERVPGGSSIVQEGQSIDALYFVLSGKFEVLAAERQVAILQAGEVVGELSYLDSRPPSATVKALTDSSVLSISRSRLTSKLRIDDAFAARFYRALGIFLADRLRGTVQRLAYGAGQALDEDVEAEDEISPDLLDSMDLAAARFDAILKRLGAD